MKMRLRNCGSHCGHNFRPKRLIGMLCRLEDAIFIFYNLVTIPRIRQVDIKTLTRRNIMLYIGVDLGTSAVKLLLMDEKGDIKKIVSKEYPLYFPHPGWSEQHPEDWFTQSVEGIKELTSECDKSQVAGISFGGQMHGLVILDKDDQVIRPAILWNDGRTTEETDYLNNEIGKETLSKYTANIAFTGFTAPKILWVKKNEP